MKVVKMTVNPESSDAGMYVGEVVHLRDRTGALIAGTTADQIVSIEVIEDGEINNHGEMFANALSQVPPPGDVVDPTEVEPPIEEGPNSPPPPDPTG